MPTDLLRIVESTTLDAETVSSRTAQIHANVLSRSKYLHAPNFTKSSGRRWYEISVSTTMLFGGFTEDDHRSITTSGITCQDRLDALQRVMEHEIVQIPTITASPTITTRQPPGFRIPFRTIRPASDS